MRGKTSEDYWEMWEKHLVDQLEERELKIGDVIWFPETTEVLGWTPHGGSTAVKQLSKLIGLPDPPQPLFRVVRTDIYSRDEYMKWCQPYLQNQAARHAATAASRQRKAEAAERRAFLLSRPPNMSGYKGVAWHNHSGLWHAAFNVPNTGGRTVSGGYHASPEDAARTVDLIRHEHGYPPTNFPDDWPTTWIRRHELRARAHPGPRGIRDAIIAALADQELTVDETFAAVAHTGTTRSSVSRTLQTMTNQGRLERVRRGVYSNAHHQEESA